jgi:hypothetical protein
LSRKKKVTFDTDYQRREIVVGSYVVKEAAMRESIRRTNMIQSAQRYIDAHPEDTELKDFLFVWPFVAGCTTPLISIEQFLEIPEAIVEELSKAAMEVNPHWFEVPDQEKKTEEPQTESTNNSEN